MQDFKFPFYIKASLIFLGLLAFGFLLFIAQGIIVPLIYSTIIAIVLSSVVDYFVRKKINRIIAIALTLLLVLTISFLIIIFLSAQLLQFGDSFPKLVEKFHQLTHQAVYWASQKFHISTIKINVWVNQKNNEIINATSSSIGQTLINSGSVLIVIVLLPVYIFMILYYQPLLIGFIHKLFAINTHTEVNEVLAATKRIIRSYLVGLLAEAGIIAVLNSTALLILGIDYAILLGVIGAMVNVIPYIGGIVAVALPMMIALTTKTSYYSCLLILAFYIIIQFIDNHYIIPKIVASKVKINALVSIIAVLAGGAIWGIPGMFLSIPLIAIIKVIFDHIESMKPWGYLLGDTMPPVLGVKFFKVPKVVFNKFKYSHRNKLKKV